VVKTAPAIYASLMDSLTFPVAITPSWTPRLPGWTLPRGPDGSECDAAFAAGIALKFLDDLIRADPPWLGCWRDRLALKSAAVAAKMLGRNEEEYALRDASLLRQKATIPGRPESCFWPHECSRVDPGQPPHPSLRSFPTSPGERHPSRWRTS